MFWRKGLKYTGSRLAVLKEVHHMLWWAKAGPLTISVNVKISKP
jgi:hypothetical protein